MAELEEFDASDEVDARGFRLAWVAAIASIIIVILNKLK
jgi:hypothetical protein|tara:strand:+ start:592 stop:708 length:117 start_codon:yes stop_codon:yes gene_type:complete